jgi:hypothetical protein
MPYFLSSNSKFRNSNFQPSWLTPTESPDPPWRVRWAELEPDLLRGFQVDDEFKFVVCFTEISAGFAHFRILRPSMSAEPARLGVFAAPGLPLAHFSTAELGLI